MSFGKQYFVVNGYKDAHDYMEKTGQSPPTESQKCKCCNVAASFWNVRGSFCATHFIGQK